MFLSFILIIHFGLYEVAGEMASFFISIIFFVIWVAQFIHFNGMAVKKNKPEIQQPEIAKEPTAVQALR